MTKIKLCGLTRPCDVEAVNELLPDFIGFVFARNSRRYISPENAAGLRKRLRPGISAVGVFTDEKPEAVAELLSRGVIDIAQLHGGEEEAYIGRLRALTDKPVVKAFRIDEPRDIARAQNSTADYVLLDSGPGGTGTVFDWNLLRPMRRPYFLAGGLNAGNVKAAVEELAPYAVDVSSGIETGGVKDIRKIREFVHAVRSVYSL